MKKILSLAARVALPAALTAFALAAPAAAGPALTIKTAEMGVDPKGIWRVDSKICSTKEGGDVAAIQYEIRLYSGPAKFYAAGSSKDTQVLRAGKCRWWKKMKFSPATQHVPAGSYKTVLAIGTTGTAGFNVHEEKDLGRPFVKK